MNSTPSFVKSRLTTALCLVSALAGLALGGMTLRGAEISDQEVLKRLTTDQPRDKAVRRGLEYLPPATEA